MSSWTRHPIEPPSFLEWVGRAALLLARFVIMMGRSIERSALARRGEGRTLTIHDRSGAVLLVGYDPFRGGAVDYRSEGHKHEIRIVPWGELERPPGGEGRVIRAEGFHVVHPDGREERVGPDDELEDGP